ncbi:major facilitator superfamily transporter [Mollisia scopiformis]|uniref:Major facilitator superfamily transporter n=1 Tax=Mollisia scopiformis TaxID=149040 RepID=A0A194XS63_MOLSC|nr:major facilitator superfamily transporter [Mollisia scopiformis]KUJ22567.1 major facilitator superfamily transporter [Mollisia scopiformis]
MARNQVSQPSVEDFDALDSMNPVEYAKKEKKLVRKIDIRLMPCLILMIILNYLDRNALANARVQGIEKDLGLEGDQFNTCISVLFAGYIALQIPSNAIITRTRPSLYLPFCMAIWGIVSSMTALVQNFTGLVLVRFFLGFVEAPYFPGALFLLSSWYTREELALRTSILYAGSLLSGGFGGLVGAGVQSGLNGARGIASWRWLFIIEGSITVFVSICAAFIIPDFPHTTKWLSQEERAIATKRLQHTSGSHDTERGPLLGGIKMAVLDYKVWLLALIIITKTIAGAVTSFIPTLVATFHYTPVQTLLLVAPPYVFATLIALLISRSSDKHSERAFHIIVPIFFGMAGFIIVAATEVLGARYLGLFLGLAGVYGSYNVALAWISSTLPRPVEKRAAAIAIVNTVGNIAQIYSPYMYPSSDGPRYLSAMIANAIFCLACIVTTLFLRWCLMRENVKLEVLEVRDAVGQEGEKEVEAMEEIVDVGRGGEVVLRRGFRYVL